MAHQTIIHSSVAVELCNKLISLLDSNSVINIYSGEVPTDLSEEFTSQVLLVSLTLPFPAFSSAVGTGGKASVSLIAMIHAEAISSGLATFFQVRNSSGTPLWQGTVGMLGCDLNLSSTNITAGVSVNLNAWEVSVTKIQRLCI